MATTGRGPTQVPTEATVAVLAGGRARRMGTDKRAMVVDGVALLTRALDAVGRLGSELLVVTAPGNPLPTPLPAETRTVTDRRDDAGPLAGIEAALLEASHEPVLVVAGDHPWLRANVVALVLAALDEHGRADAAALVTDRGAQPLLAAYRRRAVTRATGLLDAGERRARALLDALEVVGVDETAWRTQDPTGATAIDLDTPEDPAAAHPGTPPEVRPTADVGDGSGVRTRRVRLLAAGAEPRGDTSEDLLAIEEPLELRACGPGQDPVTVVTTMRTPGHDLDLAVGWLFAEGLAGPGDVLDATIADPLEAAVPDDQLTMHLRRELDLDAVAQRHATATASCGVCGRASIDELTARCAPLPAAPPGGRPVPWSTVLALPDRLREAQPLFATTGGVHATGIATPDGELVTVREDIGRHNALDAAIGAHVRAGVVPLSDHLAVVSGRVGFELVAKVAAAGIPVVVAVGAATELAARTAEKLGITLVAFVRRGRGNVHSHPGRLELTA